jgi:hypothetical protein
MLYVVVKQIESKYIEHISIPLKLVVRDIILVFGCASVTLFFASYLEYPMEYFLSMVANRPMPQQHAGPMFIHTTPPDF